MGRLTFVVIHQIMVVYQAVVAVRGLGRLLSRPREEGDGSRFWAQGIDSHPLSPLDFAGSLFYGKSRRSIHCRRATTWFGRFICNSKTVVRPMAVKPTMVPHSASIRK
jgi:hypothetical protein